MPGQAEENGWILTQYSKAFGNQYVYLSATGVKCVNPRQGIGWIAQGPQWNITFFNDKTKLYYPLSYQHWKEKITKQGLTPSDISWSKIGTGSIAGMKANKYQMSNAASSKNLKWSSAAYWLADDIKVPTSLAQLISSACGLPASDSIPLQLSYRDKNNQTVTLLQTYRQQQAKIPEQTFYLPTSYKLAKSEVAVLISQENRALLNDLAEDLGGDKTSVGNSMPASEKMPTGNLPLDKVPDQITLPNGKTVTKGQINKFLDGLK